MRLEGWHIVVIIVLAIVLFGAPKLPGLARSVGQSLRIFKSEVKQMKDENNTAEDGTDPVEGRVVNNPAPQTYAPTYQTPSQTPSRNGQPDGQHHAQGDTRQNGAQSEQQYSPHPRAGDDQAQAPVSGATHTGPVSQGGSSTTRP